MTITGTVVDESGAPAPGATVKIASNGVAFGTAVTDVGGRYSVTGPAIAYFWGTADKSGYETTLRDSYFTESPGVLNFRLFPSVRVAGGSSVHVAVTKDGSICGFDDEWFCRIVRVTAGQSGSLAIDGTADDSSLQAAVAIGTVDPGCCRAPAAKTVAAGDEVLVYVLFPWNGRVSGVTVRTSVR